MVVFSRILYSLLFSIFLISSSPSFAVVYVNSAAGGVTHDGNSWSTAYLTIQAGVNDARVPNEQVWVATGNYAENVNITKIGVEILGGFSPNPADPNPVGNRNLGSSIITPSVVTTSMFTTAAGALIDGFTIKNGQALLGAGVRVIGSSVIIQNCTFYNNSGRLGGAIYGDSNYISVKKSRFENNSVKDTAANPGLADGGAIWSIQGTLVVSDCVFISNTATVTKALVGGIKARGGAIFAQSGSNLRVERSVFYKCAANGSTQPTYFAYGGAVYAEQIGVYLVDNFIIKCGARGAGSNQSSYGGGAAVFNADSLDIRNNTFVGCEVTPNAGTILDTDRPYGLGAAVYLSGTGPASLINNIFAKNRGTAVVNSGTAVTFNYNLLWRNAGGDIWGFVFPTTNASKGIVDANLMAEPQFRLLDVTDYHLTKGSPAIDAGTKSGAPLLDIDGETRLAGLNQKVDIGADEFIDSNSDGGADLDPRAPGTDPDGDGVKNPFDNLPNIANPLQLDSNGDGVGDTSTFPKVYYVDGSVAKSGDGLTWATAFKTIQEGINAADMHNAAGWTVNPPVWVRGTKGGAVIVYIENILLWHGVKVYGGWAGTESPANPQVYTSRILSAPPAGNQTIIDGSAIVDPTVVIAQLPQDRYIKDAATKQKYDYALPVIDGFTIRNGVGELGGGVSIYKEDANVSTCRIEGNKAALGGGVYAYKSDGIVGDGIGPLPGNILNGDTTIFSNSVIGPGSYAGLGGGVYLEQCTMSLFANLIGNNTAYWGGGIAAVTSSPIITMNLIGCKINPNYANGANSASGDGGGAYLLQSDAVFDKDTIVYNQATGASSRGGGIFADTSDFVLKGSIVAFNAAVTGGAVYGVNSIPSIIYSDFYQNTGPQFFGIANPLVLPTTNISADPKFVNAQACNYRLAAGSPAIQAGAPTDVVGAARPNMGAFQDVDPLVNISGAKDLEDGITVEIRGVIVAAVFTDAVYVQQPDRACGIKVRVANSTVTEGQTVDVAGVVATIGGEKQLVAATITPALHQLMSVESGVQPLGINLIKLGAGSGKPTSVGLLVKVWGKVSEVTDGIDPVVVIKDGGLCSVNIHLPAGVDLPQVGELIVVTGVSCVDMGSDGSQFRAVRARRASDLVYPQR